MRLLSATTPWSASVFSIISAFSMRAFSSAILEYSLPCSVFASSYSLFSERSPKERASFMSSETSFSRTVSR